MKEQDEKGLKIFDLIKKVYQEYEYPNGDEPQELVVPSKEWDAISATLSKEICDRIAITRNDPSKWQVTDRLEIEESVWIVWGDALLCLEQLIEISIQIFTISTEQHCQNDKVKNDNKFYALAALLARSCLVSNEIFTLLSAGYADGAMARWRTLYEMATTASFLFENDEELASRYLIHNHVSSYRHLKLVNRYILGADNEIIERELLPYFRVKIQELVSQYGKSFCERPYGWAENVIPNATFRKIETYVELEEMRPLYNWSNSKIHAGHVSDYADLGLLERDSGSFLLGPSVVGLACPASLTAHNLSQISCLLLLNNPSVENLLCMSAIQNIKEDIALKFDEIQEDIENSGGFMIETKTNG
ncbi:MAG: hypothetical protein KQH53_11295 [Desulfarculaceae bacterium]|nr:hypothetical protein [Desulfarculaceae bacterium]